MTCRHARLAGTISLSTSEWSSLSLRRKVKPQKISDSGKMICSKSKLDQLRLVATKVSTRDIYRVPSLDGFA